MALFKKKKLPQSGIEIKHIQNMEKGFFDSMDMYFSMYCDYLKTQEFRKIDNVAKGLLGLYDRDVRVNNVIEKQKGYAKDEKELAYLEASKEYILCGTTLFVNILVMCFDYKELWKKDQPISQAEIDTAIEQFNAEYERFHQLEKNKEEAFGNLN